MLELYLEEVKAGGTEDRHHGSLPAWNVRVALQEEGQSEVPADLMHVRGYKSNQLRDDVEGVDLEFEKLRRSPSRHDLVLLSGGWIEVEEECLHETLLHDDVVSLNIEWVLADSEDLSPEELLQLEILISHLEEWLGSVPVDLIVNGVRGHLLQDALFTTV